MRKWIRRTTTLAVVAILAAIVVVSVHRVRLTRPQLLRLLPGSVDQPTGTSPSDAVGVYEGFEHAESVAGQPVFLLKALRTLGLESGLYELEGVSLELYRTGVGVAELTCDRARYDSRSRDTEVEGTVHVEFEDGTFLDTRRGSFNSSSRTFSSDSEVLFGGVQFLGRAGSFRYRVGNDSAALTDSVTITAGGGTVLRTERIVYDRRRGQAEFPEGFLLEEGEKRLSTNVATMRVASPDWRPTSVVLSEGAKFETDLSSGGWGARGTADRIVLRREGVSDWQGRAVSSDSWVELFMFGGGATAVRDLKTWELKFVFGEDGLISARSNGATCWLEVPNEGRSRWLESSEGRYYFQEGDLKDIELIGDVRLGSVGLCATAARAHLSVADARALLTSEDGHPARRVRVEGEGGVVWADELHINNESGTAEASGDIQGEMRDTDVLGPASTGDAEATRMACERLTISRTEHWMKLRGRARLWQGERLLLADEIVVNDTERTLNATGSVRMTVPASDLGDSEVEEVLIVARTLSYDEERGVGIFRGGVRMSDSKHLLSTAELVTSRGPDGRMQGFVANEQVVMESLESGRRMQGEQGRYVAETGALTVTGKPAHLTDRNGNVVSGNTLTWNRADDTVTVAGAEGAPTETIYHPEEEH